MPTLRKLVALAVVIAFAWLLGVWGAPTAAAGGSFAENVVTLVTVPAVPNMPVTFDGQSKLTDPNGEVVFVDTNDDSHSSFSSRMSVPIFETTINNSPARVEPARFVLRGAHVQLTLNIFWPISLSFVNFNSEHPVDTKQISSVTLKNSIGEEIKMAPDETKWVQGSRVVPLQGRFENKNLQLTVQQVDYQGTNVINSGQQKFFPAEEQSFAVKLLFYSVNISVGDGLFGHAVGDSVELRFPDKHHESFPLDESGSVLVPTLPRGIYDLTVMGSGVKLVQPLAVSRDQDIRVKLYTWLDVTLAVLGAASFVFITVFFGFRKKRIHRRGLLDSTSDMPTLVDDVDSPSTSVRSAQTAAATVPRSGPRHLAPNNTRG